MNKKRLFMIDDQSFTIRKNQAIRLQAWATKHFKSHCEKLANKEMTVVSLVYKFMPSGLGDNFTVECAWCKESIILSDDFDTGEFICDDFGQYLNFNIDWDKDIIKNVWGIVTEYCPTSAMANLLLQNGEMGEMHAGTFVSGLPARLPEIGDNIKANLIIKNNKYWVIDARLLTKKNTGKKTKCQKI